jgi:glycosyltransferase involved in cell wall biosynthesis
VLANGIDVHRFCFSDERRQNTRDALNVADGELFIGNTSRLAPAKNPLFQLEVFARILEEVPTARYLMMRDGDLVDEVFCKAHELGVYDRVVWFEPAPSIENLYSALDVLLFPSVHEGLPIVTIEAQCAGLPIVASTEVSHEIALTDLVQFCSPDSGVSAWADEIISFMHSDNREAYAYLVARTGYSSMDLGDALMKKYDSKSIS